MSVYQTLLNTFPTANDYQKTELDQLSSAINAKAESIFYQTNGHYPEPTTQLLGAHNGFLNMYFAKWITGGNTSSNAQNLPCDEFVKYVRAELSKL